MSSLVPEPTASCCTVYRRCLLSYAYDYCYWCHKHRTVSIHLEQKRLQLAWNMTDLGLLPQDMLEGPHGDTISLATPERQLELEATEKLSNDR